MANFDTLVEHVAARTPTVEEIDRDQLAAALAELPEEFRLVVVMFYFEELSYQEIAEELEIPVGTVMSRLSRGKSHLRQRLAPTEQKRTESDSLAAQRSTRKTDEIRRFRRRDVNEHEPDQPTPRADRRLPARQRRSAPCPRWRSWLRPPSRTAPSPQSLTGRSNSTVPSPARCTTSPCLRACSIAYSPRPRQPHPPPKSACPPPFPIPNLALEPLARTRRAWLVAGGSISLIALVALSASYFWLRPARVVSQDELNVAVTGWLNVLKQAAHCVERDYDALPPSCLGSRCGRQSSELAIVPRRGRRRPADDGGRNQLVSSRWTASNSVRDFCQGADTASRRFRCANSRLSLSGGYAATAWQRKGSKFLFVLVVETGPRPATPPLSA